MHTNIWNAIPCHRKLVFLSLPNVERICIIFRKWITKMADECITMNEWTNECFLTFQRAALDKIFLCVWSSHFVLIQMETAMTFRHSTYQTKRFIYVMLMTVQLTPKTHSPLLQLHSHLLSLYNAYHKTSETLNAIS